MTSPLEALGMIALRRLDPEAAHGMALKALQMGLGPKSGPYTSPRLATTLAGLSLTNPVGLAAGFDKNATALAPLARCGFGFVEVGAATPRPQPGNPKPRLFRLTEDRAAINRFGFNNDGMEAIAARIARRPKGGILGLNLGAAFGGGVAILVPGSLQNLQAVGWTHVGELVPTVDGCLGGGVGGPVDEGRLG